MSEIAKQNKSLSNFLNTPKTAKFLDEQLQENKKAFTTALIALVNNDKLLSECNPKDLMMCAMDSASLGLPLNKNFGYAYVIPYKDYRSGNVKPQFQIGAKGYYQLALRSKEYDMLKWFEVREGEIEGNKFDGFKPSGEDNPENPIVGYFSHFQLKGGFYMSLYMTNEQMEVHAKKYSQSYQYDCKKGSKSSKWTTDREAMGKKTVLKLLLSRYGILTQELASALDSESEDEVIISNATTEDINKDIEEAEVIEQKEDEQEQFEM